MEEGWAYKLQERLNQKKFNYEVVNASISGETSAGGANRLPQLLSKYRPTLLIIELGGNDGLRAYPTELLHNNLLRMVQLGNEHGASVFLISMEPPPNLGSRYAKLFISAYTDLKKKSKLTLLPFFFRDIILNPKLMQEDGIHPNQEAQTIILDNIWSFIEKDL